eukprot:30957-Pelagococcus_subviridis.AAC.52
MSSSRYASVWMSMCLRPSTGSGVRGGFIRGRAGRRFIVTLSSGAGAETTCVAYVLPRTTRLSNMMFAG